MSDNTRNPVSKMDLPSDPKELAKDAKELLETIIKEMIGSSNDYYSSNRLKCVADLKDLEVMLEKLEDLTSESSEGTAKADVTPALVEKELTVDEFDTYMGEMLSKAIVSGDSERTASLQKKLEEVRDGLKKYEDTSTVRIKVMVDPAYTGPKEASANAATITETGGDTNYDSKSATGTPKPGEVNATTPTPSGDDTQGATNATAKADVAKAGDKADNLWPNDMNAESDPDDWGPDASAK